jgi:hypothetical protein
MEMAKNTDLDGVRAAALAQIDRSERNYKLAFFGAAILESMFIVGFLLLANLNDRLHVLLLIATVSSYSIVVLGLVALGAHVNRSIGRVLKAMELVSRD